MAHSDQELVGLYQSLLPKGEDFASWAIMKVMEGHIGDPAVLYRNYCLKDYRENHFDKPKTDSLDAPISEDDDRTRYDLIEAPPEDPDKEWDPEGEIDMVEVKALALQLIPERERFLIQLKEAGAKKTRVLKLAIGKNKSKKDRNSFQIGWNNARMAFKRYNAMLAAAYAMKLRDAVGDKTIIDTRLEVQWVTMP